MMRILLCIILLASLHDLAAGADVGLWLAIAGSSNAVQLAIRTKQSLQSPWPQATIVASSDCENLRPKLYLTVVTTAQSKLQAQAALSKLRSQVPDAYVRECVTKPDSRLRLGVPLIDSSIEKVPENAVNWTDEDRISKLVKFPGDGYLWILRRYEADREDPREGRRESVLFFTNTPAQAKQLESDCTDPTYAQKDGWLALSCARETAAEHLLHQTKVYEATSGKVIHSISQCRRPKFFSATEISCQVEVVDKQGHLNLRAKRERFR